MRRKGGRRNTGKNDKENSIKRQGIPCRRRKRRSKRGKRERKKQQKRKKRGADDWRTSHLSSQEHNGIKREGGKDDNGPGEKGLNGLTMREFTRQETRGNEDTPTTKRRKP